MLVLFLTGREADTQNLFINNKNYYGTILEFNPAKPNLVSKKQSFYTRNESSQFGAGTL
jgi:hypothetical protein